MSEVPINNGGPFIKRQGPALPTCSLIVPWKRFPNGILENIKNQISSKMPTRQRISFPIWEIVGAGSGLPPPSFGIFRESSLGLLKRWKTSQNRDWLKTL